MALPVFRNENMHVVCPCCKKKIILTNLQEKCAECGVVIDVVQDPNEASERKDAGQTVLAKGSFWIAASCPGEC